MIKRLPASPLLQVLAARPSKESDVIEPIQPWKNRFVSSQEPPKASATSPHFDLLREASPRAAEHLWAFGPMILGTRSSACGVRGSHDFIPIGK